MQFDLFDSMSVMKKNFGDKGEILLTQGDIGIAVRLRVLTKEKLFSSEFAVSSVEMMTDNYVQIMNFKFAMAISQLERKVKEYE